MQDTNLGGSSREFPVTALDVLADLSDAHEEIRRRGFEELARAYWKPVYGYFRAAWSKSNDDAKDLTQAFFAWLLERDTLRGYDRGRGRFRPYLKTLLKHFAQHEDVTAHRLKRGGGTRLVGLEAAMAEAGASLADPGSTDPEKAFDRAWSKALLERAIADVRTRYAGRGKAAAFRLFEEYDLVAPAERPTYLALAERFSLKESDVRNTLFAVREDLRVEVRSALGAFARTPEELREEWNALFGD